MEKFSTFDRKLFKEVDTWHCLWDCITHAAHISGFYCTHLAMC